MERIEELIVGAGVFRDRSIDNYARQTLQLHARTFEQPPTTFVIAPLHCKFNVLADTEFAVTVIRELFPNDCATVILLHQLELELAIFRYVELGGCLPPIIALVFKVERFIDIPLSQLGQIADHP